MSIYRSVRELLSYYLDVYADLLELREGRLQLAVFQAERSAQLSRDLLQHAIPALALLNASNPAAHLLFNHALTLLILNSNNRIGASELLAKFWWVLEGNRPTELLQLVATALLAGVRVQAAHREGAPAGRAGLGDRVRPHLPRAGQPPDRGPVRGRPVDDHGQGERLVALEHLLQPYFLAYQRILEQLQNGAADLQTALRQCRRAQRPLRESADVLQLSADVIKNVFNVVQEVRTGSAVNFCFQKAVVDIKDALDVLEGLLQPQPDEIRSRL